MPVIYQISTQALDTWRLLALMYHCGQTMSHTFLIKSECKEWNLNLFPSISFKFVMCYFVPSCGNEQVIDTNQLVFNLVSDHVLSNEGNH